MHGWMGKILHVDLSNQMLSEIPTQVYSESYLGGRGIASRLYWESVSPQIKAFDPENHLIFMTGPFVATGTQGASRVTVAGKSPMTLPEGYCYGSIGGFVAAEMKKAGYDGIVLHGRAPKPVYLWIHDNEAEIRDASSLWGHGVYQVRDMLERTHGEKVWFITTGIAGERLVRTAVVVASHDATATAGFGAVMGSKNLKAIAVLGTGKPSVADPDRLKELSRHTFHISKRFRLSTPPSLIGDKLHQVDCIGKGGCYQCGLECIRGYYRYSNGREGFRKCQSQEVYMPWKFGKEDEPVDTFFDAPTMCNDYSLCTIETRNVIEWLHSCFRAGYLTEKETGLPLSEIGTRSFLEKLLRLIAYREGFGEILAEGLVRAGEKLPDKARALFSHSVIPVGWGDWQSARLYTAHAILYALEPRMHSPISHEVAWLSTRWRVNRINPEASEVSSEVFRAVARLFWGSDAAADVMSYEGKALAAKKIQNRMYLKESLGLCSFAWPIMDSFNTVDHLGDPTLEAKIFNAVTGMSGDLLEQYAERVFNLQRGILLREGWKLPDSIPDYNFTEPLGLDPVGRELFVPGPDGKPVSTKGNILNREKFAGMMQEYYALRGWNPDTGLPRLETLKALGLEDVASSLIQQGYEL